MPNIIELDQNLINKIAAGEVIERPASVVKELVENSMDAGATSITVEIAEGGKSLIKITDDGHGIEADELPTAIKRHSTSKIKSAEDLFNISTLGFRGEALASIGSVSYMKITSKIKSADSAQLIEVEDGRLITNKPAAANNGTTIEVNNLFFNVPARKKHQKSMQAEFRHILDIITRYILINPQIQFKLIHNDKIVITSPSSTNTLANVATVYGRSITKSLVPINFSFFDIEIMGFISKPELTRADRTYQSIYVNKRHIKNSTVQRAVYDGYGELLFHGRHPIFILDIKIDPQKIDVNVHPQKSEIRIQKEQELYSAVRNAIISAFSDEKLIPQIQEFKTKLVDQKLIITDKDDFGKSQSTLSSHASTSHSDEESDEKAETKSELRIKLIGKLHNTYVIAQDEEGMLLVDQHAAHERVMYEKLLNDFKNDSIKVQELISPLMIEANPNEKLIIEGNIELLKSLGIMIEHFGKSTFVIRALPNILQKQQTPALINDIIDELNNDELKKITKIKEERIAMAACKSAVKAHDVLEFPQIYKILDELFACENPNTCPHGRPTMIHFPLYELEKKFKRKV
ncbi:DNA mismatch repair endonuclease MutL [Candidatus Woesearchaeota archaeon]|jgi:DNA mismatch repair protein MutL|nr:DNA mismatch repair endonuclease MutL [Candidatus Woesearchaeota archaeon]MBT5272514.1 DNA mismatch repair endonuclease MutL [Candidatus Woesearchaeota archaeon]MBT6041478.1 DNA mismatch repair endonuclease MutL [Candidatus Woesearchaeota archaeon]MBT6336376.1 DNA mismatch repair endonuclease MutL [Candidatus Woesearchaeota archaeon]MBT7927697.1 DNA mismatch repair endonuclease MutL [Candidatus Woesearchaeota archaeon]